MIQNGKNKILTAGTLIPFILLTSCFAWWGLANNMTDTLLAAFKRIKSMTDFQTSLIQMAFYGAYFCFAIPAALYIRKYTYKSGVLLGLALFILGGLLFYPASISMEYWHFLAALYILAGGLSILETSANPYILAFGPRRTATQRLNLAQSFNPIGSISGVIISKFFILSNLNQVSSEERASMDPEMLEKIQSDELAAVMGPYVTVSFVLVAVWVLISLTKMPCSGDKPTSQNFSSGVKRLLSNKHYIMGVVAQFFYVGAQIGVWSFTIRYVMQELSLNEEKASSYYIASLIVFSVSRFACTAIMSVIRPAKMLVILAVVASICTLLVITGGGMAGVIALICISGCMSLMFPTIYGIALRDVGEDTKIGGSGLIMAILGGAVLTAVQGQVSDTFQSISLAFSVPLVCFLIIVYYGWQSLRYRPEKV